MLIQPINIEGYMVKVVLPYNYGQSATAYPVVYVQDGGDMVMDGYNQLDYLARTKQIEPCIYVGIEPIDRNHDYTPWPAPRLTERASDFEGKAESYLHTLVTWIKPYIDKNYRTKPGARYTAIAGGSFGALVSLFASYWCPDTLGKYILLSASVWYEGVMEFLREEKSVINRDKHKMYMYVGDCEGIYHLTRQRHMVPCSKEAAELLKRENFHWFEFVMKDEGTHDAHFFAYYFIEAMKKLFPAR
ncbi:alpha/beta hydrolase-fold protein [Bacillus sp. PK3_68]|uniref:alpha/beta hydrolase n=1 Tax=Bacillus sp. PK3_68 TaxID=2027408 RepID=UPI000E75127B|nr:alpha/beta hydrolase-fold protein [Bacillus sp. PK3_68]RJS61128.1 hypothetical protein CJ483_14615 [Bacillus sp. PK3_68]